MRTVCLLASSLPAPLAARLCSFAWRPSWNMPGPGPTSDQRFDDLGIPDANVWQPVRGKTQRPRPGSSPHLRSIRTAGATFKIRLSSVAEYRAVDADTVVRSHQPGPIPV